MKAHYLLAVPGVVILMACAPPSMTAEQKSDQCGQRPDMDDAERAVQRWVQNSGLKDPFSAQTQNIRIGGMGGIQNGILNGGEWRFGWIVSFQVNAKNSYGAYVGWRPRYLLWNNGNSCWATSPTSTEPGPPSPL